jgi:hypothetical protein
LRENQDTLSAFDPSKISGLWVPTRKVKVTDKAIQKEGSDNLNWWRNAGCPCSVDEVGPHDKARIEALLDLARTIEQTRGATDSPERLCPCLDEERAEQERSGLD